MRFRHLLTLISVGLIVSTTIYLPFIRTTCPPTGLSLRELAVLNNTKVGAAVGVSYLRFEPLYQETLKIEFNSVTDEWSMKWDVIHPNKDSYAFTDADFIVDFAVRNGMAVRGHSLVWHEALPDWLTDYNWTRDELLTILHEHITTLVEHYKGKVYAWDVVNEALNTDGSLRSTIWLDTIGPEYIDLAFQWAHEADPDAILFYNDFGIETAGPKQDALIELLRGLLQRGIPVHGAGLQMHSSNTSPPPAQLATAIERISNLGLQVQVTEMDVQIYDDVGTFEEKLQRQADQYRGALQVCLDNPACTGVTLWGFTDAHSWVYWLLGHSYPEEAPLIFDPDYQPKPAYFAMTKVLGERYCQLQP